VSVSSFHGRKPLIVILDNEESWRIILSQALHSEGFMVFPTESKQDFIEELGTITPDLIISDVMSPQLNGRDFLERIKADSRFEHIPVIYCTGYRELTSQLYHRGAYAVFAKPLDMEKLFTSIRNALSPFPTS
jgi:DNA-binding NtrC family response regulator